MTHYANVLRGPGLKPAVVLLLSPWLMVTWAYYGSFKPLQANLPDAWLLAGDRATSAAIYSFVAAFILLGLIPALVVKFVFRERLADYGVCWGDRLRTPRSMAIGVPLFVLAGYLGAGNASLRAVYPIAPGAGASLAAFALHAATYLLYYLGWEFHFRGFLQHGLRTATGDTLAVLVQVLASCLLHLGRPAVETYASILGGLLWGLLALRNRSLLSGLVQHYALGVSVDWFVLHG